MWILWIPSRGFGLPRGAQGKPSDLLGIFLLLLYVSSYRRECSLILDLVVSCVGASYSEGWRIVSLGRRVSYCERLPQRWKNWFQRSLIVLGRGATRRLNVFWRRVCFTMQSTRGPFVSFQESHLISWGRIIWFLHWFLGRVWFPAALLLLVFCVFLAIMSARPNLLWIYLVSKVAMRLNCGSSMVAIAAAAPTMAANADWVCLLISLFS